MQGGSPHESVEGRALIRIANLHKGKWPELSLLFHVPNEGKRDQIAGALLVAAGMRKGVSDYCLPVARRGYTGLFIELKRRKRGVMTDEQDAFLEGVRAQGYRGDRCNGAEEAWEMMRWYLAGQPTPRVLQPETF